MDATSVLPQAQAALLAVADRNADLVRSLPVLDIRVPGSKWNLREVAAHIVTASTAYTEFARGTPSPIMSLEKEALAAACDQLIADVPETDPEKLAALVRDSAGELVEATSGRRATEQVCFHAGLPLDLGRLVSLNVGEYLVHGFEMARAVGRPWPIDPADARLVIHGYELTSQLFLNPKTTSGLTAAYEIDLRGFEGFTIRFTDGVYSVEPTGAGSVDCWLSADPVAFLLVHMGRLDSWTAVTLGLVTPGGPRPDLALGFFDLFTYP